MVSQLMKPLGSVWDATERKRRLDSRPFFMRFATSLLLYLSVFPACACILPTPCRLSVPGGGGRNGTPPRGLPPLPYIDAHTRRPTRGVRGESPC